MHLPFRLVIELPDRAELRRATRSWRAWAVVAGILAATVASFLALHHRVQEAEAVGSGALEVASSPTGATVEVDGRTRGQTPAVLRLSPEDHHVILRHGQYADVSYQIGVTTAQTTTLHTDLWLRTPHVERLRPTFPGSVITNAHFLSDGRVALSLALPPGNERQLWVLDHFAAAHRLGPPDIYGPIAVSADSTRVAYLARQPNSALSQDRLDEVWVASTDGGRGARHYVLPLETSGDSLVDLAWAPDGQGLVLVGRQALAGGGKRTQLRWLSMTDQETRDLVTLPSEVVPGSYLWSPNGLSVAFLSSTDQATSLCLLDTRRGQFRYFSDVNGADAQKFAFPPVAWSPDGERLLYAAPAEERVSQSGWLFGARPPLRLFITGLAETRAQRLGDAEGQAPVWRSDGVILVLARVGSNKPLVLRQVAMNGESQEVGEVPLQAGSTFAVRWDAEHAQAIITLDRSGGLGNSQPDYWLVSWRPEEAR